VKTLSSLKVQNACSVCQLHTESFFCDLEKSTLREFEALKITNTYPKGATLFFEGQDSNGIYMLCQGRVKLTTCSRDGKVIILRVAEAGEVLGLSATVTASTFKATAEVVEPCQVNFVKKEEFVRFLERNGDAALSAVKQLSHIYHAAYVQICSLGLASSVADKLARLLLTWSEVSAGENGRIHLQMNYTQEEIAEMIGTSRETVSRLLKDFRERKLISVNGSEVVIHSREKLEDIIGTKLSSTQSL
jgi:CRP/FNR family transcriptional regulator